MLSRDKQYRTRDGDECIFLIRMPRGDRHPWLATLKDAGNGSLYQEYYTDDGSWSDGNRSELDLIESDALPQFKKYYHEVLA